MMWKPGRYLPSLALAVVLLTAMPASAKVEGGFIFLGSAISFTGKYATNGIHSKNGYHLAVKTINQAGGVKVGGKTYKLKVVYYDDESVPARAAELVERLIKDDGIKFLLGPYSSATTGATAKVTERLKVPMVTAEAASRALFTQGYKYLFSVLSTSEQYLSSAIALAAALASKAGKAPGEVKVAMAFENDPFSLDVRAGVLEDVKKHGFEVVIDDRLPADLSDMSATLRRVRASEPDMLLVSGHSKGAATAARQIAEFKIKTPMIAMTHCESAKIVKKFAAAVEGFLCPTQWAETMSYKDSLFGTAAEYDSLFKKSYRGYANVPYQAAQASAAVMVWKDALERAQSFDIEKVRAALAATEMQTFYGPIKFSEAGKNVAKPMALRQIQDGKFNVVASARFASHQIIHPRRAN